MSWCSPSDSPPADRSTTPPDRPTQQSPTHAYPTYNDGVWNASIEDVRSRLRTPTAVRALRVLSTTRRRWIGSSLKKGLDNRPGPVAKR